MTKLNFFYLAETETLELYLKSKSYFDNFYNLKKNFSKLTIVNFSKIMGKDIKNNNFKKILKKKNINYLCPSTTDELLKILKKKNSYAFFKAPFGLKYFKILKTVSKSKIKLIQIANFLFTQEKKAFEDRDIKQSFRIIFKIRLINYFHRLMCALGFYPKVDIHFDCDQSRIDLINNSISKKIDKFIPLLNLSYYKKIIRINSKYYSDFIRSKNDKIEKKYIIVCDTPLAHEDFLLRDGHYNVEKVEKFYKNLNLFLINIQKILKKKVIICLHPKGEYDHFKNFLVLKKNFKTVFFKTEYYISKSYLILNTISSTINYAIMQNKPIFILKSKYYGSSTKSKIKVFQKEYNYPIINIDQFKGYNFIKILKNKNLEKFNDINKKKLIYKKNITDTQQVINYLNK
jgi:hypothetical protein